MQGDSKPGTSNIRPVVQAWPVKVFNCTSCTDATHLTSTRPYVNKWKNCEKVLKIFGRCCNTRLATKLWYKKKKKISHTVSSSLIVMSCDFHAKLLIISKCWWGIMGRMSVMLSVGGTKLKVEPEQHVDNDKLIIMLLWITPCWWACVTTTGRHLHTDSTQIYKSDVHKASAKAFLVWNDVECLPRSVVWRNRYRIRSVINVWHRIQSHRQGQTNSARKTLH